ncbi:hypothetical protein ACIQLG_19750 [Terribacillus saccharophilus]|uniref:hypothetical protein n=1 Tax=Terribacillus saccharophilus TaxID=361277 RepID=UPI0037FE8ABB
MAESFKEFEERFRQKLRGHSSTLKVPKNRLYIIWLAASVLKEMENEKKSRR